MDYQASAEKVSNGVSGALPAGSDIKFPTAGVRGESPFEKFCEAQDKDFVMAATSGVLSMLQGEGGGGLNKGPHKEHDDQWQKIALMKGKRINETLRSDFDLPELAEAFPGQPVCVQFTLAVQDEEDSTKLAETVVAIEGVGLQTDAKEISDRLGLKLTRVAKPAGPAAPGKGPNPMEEDVKSELGAAIRNRLLNRDGAATGEVPPDLEKQFLIDVSADFAPIVAMVRKEAAAIRQIADPDLRQKRTEELQAQIDALTIDAMLSPRSASSLAGIIVAGLNSKPVEKT
jgi:phage gp29-like protein